MDQPPKKAARSKIAAQQPFPRERARFKVLRLSNPNFFGNLLDSKLKPVTTILNNTFYEQIGCLGYHPQKRVLEAVVYINEPTGYGSDICGFGTPEFVRFYLSFDNGATWQDQGMTSFQVYNVPEGTQGSRRLEYAASMPVNPPRRFCFFNPLIQARAILSWNNPPPANSPNWPPIFGNVVDSTILVEPIRFIPWPELFEVAKIELPPDILNVIDLSAPVKTKQASPSIAQLAELYKDAKVPVHRFAYKQLAQVAGPKSTLSLEAFAALNPGIEINPDIFDQLFPTGDGNTDFEQLNCIGLDPNTPDTLVGVIQVKLSSGYSGAPCTDGSKEYVTFWADFDGNNTFETCLGTADVTVYDTAVPAGGVQYAVRLPVDLSDFRRNCKEGPVVVKIRAILSWNVPMDCSDPNATPVWGNREETLILVSPAAAVASGKIAILGGIPVSMIDDVTGLTTPDAIFALNNLPADDLGRPCPFGLRVSAQGAPIVGFSYIVEVSPNGLVWTPLLTDLEVTDSDGNVNTHSANPITNRFDYLPFTENVNSLIAHWDTAGDALWFVRLSVYNGGGILQGTDTHKIQLDNTGPDATIEITTGLGDCGKFDEGLVLTGNYTAIDDYLRSWSIGVEPAINTAPIGVPSPTGGNVNTSPAPGDAWTLDTNDMQACGYIIRIVASDRAILNSSFNGHFAGDSSGFCIEEPTD